MTATEKTRLLAERVMECNVVDSGVPGVWVAFKGVNAIFGSKTWDPLTNLSHAGEVLEAMAKKGWHTVIICPASGRYYCDFYRGLVTNRDGAYDCHESLSSAICHAALLAEGVKEEEL